MPTSKTPGREIEKLAAGEEEAWTALAEQVIERREPAPALAAALWERDQELAGWLGRLTRAGRRSDAVQEVEDWRANLVAWFRDSVLAAFPADHEAAVEVRLQAIRQIPGDDGGLADAMALLGELTARGHTGRAVGEAALLVAKGAFTERAFEDARRHAELAAARFEAADDAEGRDRARRHLLGALLHLRQWPAAFELADDVLQRRGPLFGGGGATVWFGTSDPREAALDELQAIALWASKSTPEWVRALGALAEVFAGDPAAPALEGAYQAALAGIARADGGHDPLDALAVVIQQLRERSHSRAAAVAARAGVQAAPGDLWIRSVCANLSRDLGEHEEAYVHRRAVVELVSPGAPSVASSWMELGDAAATLGRFEEADAAFETARGLAAEQESQETLAYYVARSFRGRDAAKARALGFGLFDRLRCDPRALAESQLGFAVVELVLGMLLEGKDRRALEVQRALLDAKVELWGDGSAVWLEEHNLGTVHAQLGDLAEARRLIEGALAKLRSELGDDHPHVQLAERSLARLEAERL